MVWWGRGMKKTIDRMVRRLREKGRLDAQRRYEVYEVGTRYAPKPCTVGKGGEGESNRWKCGKAKGQRRCLNVVDKVRNDKSSTVRCQPITERTRNARPLPISSQRPPLNLADSSHSPLKEQERRSKETSTQHVWEDRTNHSPRPACSASSGYQPPGS
jgi:hypothetical protein